MEQPAEFCEHLASCPQCQAFIDQLSDNPEMRRWAPARQSLLNSEPCEPVLDRLLEELRSTPLADNRSPQGVGEPAGTSLGFLEAPRQAGDLGALGPYRVLAELGRGGMGIVLLAYDPNLKRKAALKVLPPYRADEQARSRFVREAQAAAGLDHDNVVPVYAVANPADGPPYLVMQYVEGPTVREQIKKEGQLNPLVAARMAAQVADGLAAAHDAGLIHRDIKPGNIILDRAHGRAKIMDFGLVRLTYIPGTTQQGTLMGTPEYMSPEQVRDPEHLDARTDIYSLGVTLYEALTGEVPFRGVAHMVHQQILQDEPRPPRRLNDRIPRDLETICLQCLRKEPGQRYASARALADDLQRFLHSEPVRARPVRLWERGWRWARRNAPLAATGAIAVVALVAGVIVSALFAVRELREHQLAERRLAESYMERAFTFAGQEQDYARGLLWLARALETAPESATDLQRTIRANLSAWGGEFPPLKTIIPQPVAATAFSPDGRTVLTGSWDHTARLWDAATGDPIGPPLPHHDRIWAVAFSPDGRTALTGSFDGTVRRWNASTGEPIGIPLQHPKAVRAVSFSPDGRTIITGCFDGVARRWDAASGQPMGQPLTHPRGINAVAYSPDGRIIATGGRDQKIRLWDAATRQPLGEPLPCDGDVRVVAFSSDGRTLLTGGINQATRLWDVATARVVRSFPNQGNIITATLSPDGKAVLTGSGIDERTELWHAATGQPLLGPPLRQQGWVSCVAFSPDGGTFLTAVGAKGPRLWNTTRPFVPGSLLRHPGQVLAVAFSPDSKTILTGGSDHAARFWDAATGKELGQLPHQDRVKAVTFSRDGKKILTGSSDEKAQLWDVATLKPIGSPLHHPPAWVSGVAFSPDGKMVVTSGFDGAARRWDVAMGKELDPPLRHDHEVRAVAFSPDGKTILTGSFDQTARLWDAATGKPLALILRHPDWIHTVAFSPDGETIVTGGADQKAHRWRASTGEPLGPPLQHHGDVTAVTLSPDGRMILTGSTDQTARLWDGATGSPLGPPFYHRAGVMAVAFSPDGKRVLTGSLDRTARLWDVPFPLPGTVKRIALWTQVLTGMELDEYGAARMLDAGDWQERRRRLEELGGPLLP